MIDQDDPHMFASSETFDMCDSPAEKKLDNSGRENCKNRMEKVKCMHC